jgi:DNA-binding IclR family transcriptional regulator
MSTVQSLGRAIELLRLISAEHTSGARLSDLVAASGLPQPTVHRLLRQMVEGGLVMQDAQRRYRLGHFAYELGLVASTHFHLRDQCAPHLGRISAETGDTAFLMVRSGADSFCLDRQSGSFPIQVLTVQVGKRRPLGIGGGGLALLSFMPREDLPGVLDRIEPHLAPYGGLTRRILLGLCAHHRLRRGRRDQRGRAHPRPGRRGGRRHQRQRHDGAHAAQGRDGRADHAAGGGGAAAVAMKTEAACA